MADFSPSGVYGLPGITAATIKDGDPRVIGWILEAIDEGDRLNRADPSYDKIEKGMAYVVGDQLPGDSADAKLAYIPKLVINESRKAMQAHVSALTDLKPTFGWKSENPKFQENAHLLNKRTVAWWISTMADQTLGDTVKLSLAGGTGDLAVEWDPFLLGGENIIIAKDPRDTIPIRPGNNKYIQHWQGVIIREEHSINALRGKFPTKAHLFQPASDTVVGRVAGKFRTLLARIVSPAADTLAGLNRGAHVQVSRSGTAVIYKCYLTDLSRNMTGKAITLGDPDASWSYVVPPGGAMYPNKRLIVCTDNSIIYDGPSPYWHGMYPINRLMLWSVPWQFLGVPMFNDLFPVQDAINGSVNDIKLAIRQWMGRTTAYNKDAVSATLMKRFDPRMPDQKIQLNPMAGEGFKQLDGVPPQVIALALEFWEKLSLKHADLSGTANLSQLLQMRATLPGADTLEKYNELLTPELRAEGRQMEIFLRDVATQCKGNWFQYETKAKRLTILGDAGMGLEDFDYVPDSLVPALKPIIQQPGSGLPVPNPDYTAELDASLPRDTRAQNFMRQLVFVVAPNSILAMNAQTEKMMRFQLARMGYYDFWSLMESMEIPNVGSPPPIPLPPLKPPTIEEVAESAMNGENRFTLDPASGQILEIRSPMTVTERLMAQQLMGIGMTENPAGRKASGQETPREETKSDGRSTVTESSH